MTESPPNFRLNPVTLRYGDAELEQEYLRHAPATLVRGVRPVAWALFPFLCLVALLEYSGVMWLPGDALTAAGIATMVLVLLATARWAGRWIEPAVVATFIVSTALLFRHIRVEQDLLVFMPGLFLIVTLALFVGIRYIQGVVTSLALILVIVALVLYRELDPALLLRSSIFLLPALAIAASVAYTVDRQRRRLFAQVREMEAERDTHAHMALHDPLTGLPNRALLRERMLQSLARARRHHGQVAVLFVDLDNFKSVNDTYGHGVGDDVLRQLAQNLTSCVRDEDTVARLGGDEFVVLSEQVQDDQAASIAADRVRAAVSEPVPVKSSRADTVHVNLTCSIGIALCPRDGQELDDLMNRADAAMYRAKRGGKNATRFFQAGKDVKEPGIG